MPSLTKIQTGFLEPQGAFELTPGTASSPGLFFSGNTSTGMFSPSAGVLGFSTGSTQQALTILADGKVGIGTDNPAHLLHLEGSSPIIQFEDTDNAANIYSLINGAGSAGRLLFQVDPADEGNDSHVRFDIDGSEKFRITSSGNVGIGTDNPLEKLQVAGVVRIGVNTPTHETFRFTTQGADEAKLIMKDASNNEDVVINTGGSSWFKGGNVGIGTDNPQGKLVVSNGSAGLEFNPNSGQAIVSYNRITSAYTPIGLQGSTVGLYIGGVGEALHISNTGNARLQADNTTSNFTISNITGTTYILDTTTPSAVGTGGRIVFGSTYYTQGNTMGTAYIGSYKENAPSNGPNEYNHSLVFGTNNYSTGVTERLRITSTGNVGIGTNNPTAKLDVRGSIVVDYDLVGISSVFKTFSANHSASNRGAKMRFGLNDGGFGGIEVENVVGSNSSFNSQTVHIINHNGGVAGDIKSLTARYDGNIGIGTTNPVSLLQVGSRTSATPQGIIDVVRGETLGGGTGPSIRLIHGPDSGTQRTHSIHSYIGDLRIFADANENLELSASNVIFKDANRTERFHQSGGVFYGLNNNDYFLSKPQYVNSFSLSGYTVSAGTIFTVIPAATLNVGLYLIAVTYTQNGGPYHHKAAATFYVSSKNSASPNSNWTEGGIQHSHVGGSYLVEFQETPGSTHVVAGVRVRFNYSLSTTGSLHAYAYRIGH